MPDTDAVALSAFRHCRDDADIVGRDRWTGRAATAWVRGALSPLLATLVADASLLPVSRSVFARGKVVVLRAI